MVWLDAGVERSWWHLLDFDKRFHGSAIRLSEFGSSWSMSRNVWSKVRCHPWERRLRHRPSIVFLFHYFLLDWWPVTFSLEKLSSAPDRSWLLEITLALNYFSLISFFIINLFLMDAPQDKKLEKISNGASRKEINEKVRSPASLWFGREKYISGNQMKTWSGDVLSSNGRW